MSAGVNCYLELNDTSSATVLFHGNILFTTYAGTGCYPGIGHGGSSEKDPTHKHRRKVRGDIQLVASTFRQNVDATNRVGGGRRSSEKDPANK